MKRNVNVDATASNEERPRRRNGAQDERQVTGPGPLGVVGGVAPPPREGNGHHPSLTWTVEHGAAPNYRRLGRTLAAAGDLYRNGEDGHGLVLVLPSGDARSIVKAADLAPVIVDRIRMRVVRQGKVTGELPTSTHLNGMLRSETFLGEFLPVDEVTRTPFYIDDWSLVQPGYTDGGPGNRVMYIGDHPSVVRSTDTIRRFLDVMAFASEADRTNAVAAGLTTLLRRQWPGEKPLVLVTATKSHAGKGTVTDFIRGSVPKADILYESVDWPMQGQFQRQIPIVPDLGMVLFDNVRLDSSGSRAKVIRSAFVESFVTSPNVTLALPGGGEPLRLHNKFVVVLNTNDGALSPDLMNRCLPIHLAPQGDVRDRQTPIGNPKLEFLPENRDRIQAEFRGMIETWKEVDCPSDKTVRHPMSRWAATIGGILQVNGFSDFLANYGTRQSADTPVRNALGILGASHLGQPLRPMEWGNAAVTEGVVSTLFSSNERDNAKSRERAIGVIMTRHRDETFEVATERTRYRLRLEGGFRRWTEGKNPHVRYVFTILEETPIPVEGEVTPAQ